MPNAWPSWLDEVESKLAERDRSCLDCGVLVDGQMVYPVYRGDGCEHSTPPKTCDFCGRSFYGPAWVAFEGATARIACSDTCTEATR